MRLTLKNFFSHLIFYPLDANTRKEKAFARVASIACGVFSIGICHLICAICRCFTRRSSDQTNVQDKKIEDLRKLTIFPNLDKVKSTAVIDSIDLKQILSTTLQSLKNGLFQHKIDEYISIKMNLKINNESFQYIAEDSQEVVHKIDDLLVLEYPAREMIQKIFQNLAHIGKSEKVSVKWDFILTNIDGIHTFSFSFEKTSNYCITNGALFGSPGYSFRNTNSSLSAKELEGLPF